MKKLGVVNADELNELARPLVRYLSDNCPPNCAVVVSTGGVEVVKTLLTVPKEYEYRNSERKKLLTI